MVLCTCLNDIISGGFIHTHQHSHISQLSLLFQNHLQEIYIFNSSVNPTWQP